MAFSRTALARGHSLFPMRVRQHRDRGEIKIEKKKRCNRTSEKKKKKKKERKEENKNWQDVFLRSIFI